MTRRTPEPIENAGTLDDESRTPRESASVAPTPALLALEVVDPAHYDLEGEQGRGGLGRVLRAWDRRLNRLVAVKELLHRDTQAQERFLREVRITAKLQHPGIVPIHEAGRWPSGEPFYAMKLVEGQTLKALLAAASTLNQRLVLLPHVVAVADAIAFAHTRNIIHRDLKPSNVVVGAFGETVVIDWGLAKDLGSSDSDDATGSARSEPVESGQTRVGEVLGTPSYMAPEQAAGERVGKSTDVYAIGCILYHLISGTAPYDESETNILERVAKQPPPPLSTRSPNAPVDLVAIANKAMARNADERYFDAAALAEDLRRFQSGQLVSVRQYTAGELLRRWTRRNLPLVITGGIAAAILLAVSVAALLRVVQSEEKATAGARAADMARREAVEQRNDLILLQARSALERDPTQAIAWAKQYPRDGARAIELEEIVGEAERTGVARHTFQLTGEGRHMQFTGDEEYIIVSSWVDPLRVWHIPSGREIQPLGDWLALFAETARVGNRVAYVQGGTNPYVTQVGGKPTSIDCEASSGGIALSRGGEAIACAEISARRLSLFDVDGNRTSVIPLRTDVSGSVARTRFSPDGRYVFISTTSGSLVRVDLWTRREWLARVPRGGDWLAPNNSGGTYFQDDVTSVWYWPPDSEEATRLTPAVSADSSEDGLVLAVSRDQTVTVRSMRNGLKETSFDFESPARAVALSPDGDTLAVGLFDGSIVVEELHSGLSARLYGHKSEVRYLAFSSTGGLLSSISGDVQLRVWRRPLLRTRNLAATPDARSIVPTATRLSLDGACMATVSDGGRLFVWSQSLKRSHDITPRATFEAKHVFFPSSEPNLVVAVGADDVFGLKCPDGTIAWSWPTGESIASADLASDGRTLLLGTRKGALLYRRLDDPMSTRSIPVSTSSLRIAASPTEPRVAAIDDRGHVFHVDLSTQSVTPIVTVDGYNALAFRGAHALVWGPNAGQVWDIEAGTSNALRFFGPISPVRGIVLDGAVPQIFYGNLHGDVYEWVPGRPQERIRAGTGNLSMTTALARNTVLVTRLGRSVSVVRSGEPPLPSIQFSLHTTISEVFPVPHLGLFLVFYLDGSVSSHSYFDLFHVERFDPWERANSLTSAVIGHGRSSPQ